MKRFTIILCCLLSVILISLVGCCNDRFRQTPTPIDVVYDTDTCEQYEEYLPTVYDILQEREEMRYMVFIDSVYLKIPEQILTHILITKGTTVSIMEIVENYINNKDYYHNTILKAMNIQKNYAPDKLPKKSVPNKPIEPLSQLDTIN